MQTDHSWRIQRILHGIAFLHNDLLNAGAGISTIRIGTEARDKIAVWTGDDRYETHQQIRGIFAKHDITETDPPCPGEESYLTGGTWSRWGLDVEIDARMGPTIKQQGHLVALLFVGGLHYLGVHSVSVSCATIRRPGDGVSERVLITVPRSATGARVLDPGAAGRLTEITRTRRGMNGIDWVTDGGVLVSVIRAMPTGNLG